MIQGTKINVVVKYLINFPKVSETEIIWHDNKTFSEMLIFNAFK